MIELEGVASVADLPRVQAIRRGGAPALVFEGRTTTFAEVDATASRIANALIAFGVRTQERIAYLSKNTDDFLIWLIGACKARVTLALFNFRLAAPEVTRLIEDSGAGLMIVGPDVADLADQAIAPLASKPRMIALGFGREAYERCDEWLAGAAAQRPPARGGARGRRDPGLHLGHHRRFPKGFGSPTATTSRFSSSRRPPTA